MRQILIQTDVVSSVLMPILERLYVVVNGECGLYNVLMQLKFDGTEVSKELTRSKKYFEVEKSTGHFSSFRCIGGNSFRWIINILNTIHVLMPALVIVYKVLTLYYYGFQILPLAHRVS